MLNGEDNENGFKTNRSNQQKKKTKQIAVQHTFSTNQQKTNLHVACSFPASRGLSRRGNVQHAFLSFLCRCFARLQRCFVGIKRQTSLLHIIFKEELSYVLTQYFVSCVHIRFYFSLPLMHFHLAGRQYLSFSHGRFDVPCFSSY